MNKKIYWILDRYRSIAALSLIAGSDVFLTINLPSSNFSGALLLIIWPRAVTRTHLNWRKRNLLRFKRAIILNGEFLLRVEFYSLCANVTQIRFWYQGVIIDNELHIRFELDCHLSIIINYRATSVSLRSLFDCIESRWLGTFSRNSRWSWGIKRLAFSIHQSYSTRFYTIKYWTEAYQGS